MSTQRMNVLLAVPWNAERGGVVAVVQNVARHLRDAGHGVIVFHPGGPVLRQAATKIGFPGVQLKLTVPAGRGGIRGILRALAFPFLFVSSLAQLWWFLRSRRIQIVNLHYPYDNYLYFAVCRWLLPIRLVSSVHGRDAFYQERPRAHYSFAFRLIIRNSDLIILPSEAYRRKLLEAFPDAADRTIFIHNGVEPSEFTPLSHDERLRGRPFILCVAELQEYKAIDVLLHAARPILLSDPSLTLVLAGGGPMRAELEELSVALGIRHQTMFLGTQGRHEIARLMQTCRMMVLPSRMEPFGIVLIEAMACKTPVVASDIGGVPEIIEHQRSGILVTPENHEALTAAIRRLLADDGLARTIAESGYARVMERFCARHQGAHYLDTYASLLGSTRRRRLPPPLADGERRFPSFPVA